MSRGRGAEGAGVTAAWNEWIVALGDPRRAPRWPAGMTADCAAGGVLDAAQRYTLVTVYA